MRTLWPIGSVSDETLLLSLVRSSLAVPQAAERAKTFETNPTHLRYMRGLIGVLQRVTISLLSRVRLFTPSKAARPSSCLIHPSAGKVNSHKLDFRFTEFSEVQLRDAERFSVRSVMSSSCSQPSPTKE